jgi:hypothetical protein
LFFVSPLGVETKEKAAEILEEELFDDLSDVNVSTLKVTCFRAQDDEEQA